MGKLTPKQERFCLLYIGTGNASEAYRGAYDASKMKPATVNKKAYELLQNGHITARIDELNAAAAEKAELSRAWVLERLMRNACICMGEQEIKMKVFSKTLGNVIEIEACDRDAGAANQALSLLGKELGMFVERIENINEKYVVGSEPSKTDDAFEKKYKLNGSSGLNGNGKTSWPN